MTQTIKIMVNVSAWVPGGPGAEADTHTEAGPYPVPAGTDVEFRAAEWAKAAVYRLSEAAKKAAQGDIDWDNGYDDPDEDGA